ncbi:MAG: glycine--tRNA ligase subunit beta [Pseudomonadota bacterium]|nr:glycine--tRNA ligase subunit beta [Pseudomonadota bacterium]
MSDADTLTVELLTEELPPKALKRLGESFASGIVAGLSKRGYVADAASFTGFATPRRLAVTIEGVLARSADRAMVQRLMPAAVALDANGPTKALRKKLASMGREVLGNAWDAAAREARDGPDRMYVEMDGKADAVFFATIAAGLPLERGLSEALDETIDALPIPKVMGYASASSGDGRNDVKFVRPAHRLLSLHGPNVVDVFSQRLQLKAGRTTAGHRFLSRADLVIASARAYQDTLEAEGKVVPRFDARRARIEAALQAAAHGATVIMPAALLDEVAALVEWPVVYAGTFDAAFLQVPQECLVLTMQQNQKYFALADTNGRLVNRFLLVSNLETETPRAIIEGNERVLRARLSDARFFYDQDRRRPLAERVPRLASIVYHNKLGTLGERVVRVGRIAEAIAAKLGADVALARRSAELAKADLLTDMVGEFPELQGLMGRYYAAHDGEAPAVAQAIEQHYWPRFAGDALPVDAVAQSLALADKLELLAGMFAIGAQPTGDRDPFGLRRGAIGVLRILIEARLALSLPDLIALAYEPFNSLPAVKPVPGEVIAFVYDRLRGYLRDQGYTANQIAAVVDAMPAEIHLVPARLAAVQAFEALPEAQALSAANKRIVNILRKSAGEAAPAVDRARLTDGAEHDLYLAFQKLEPIVDDRCAAGDYGGALTALAAAKPVVDRFFDDVMVMADDPLVRGNRLALLRGVSHTMNRVADISRLAM